MEDISRELEKEIALAKPKPYKQDRKTRVLIVDDFGEMKSGEYLKKLVRVLGVLCLFFAVATVVLFLLYSWNDSGTSEALARLEAAEKKVAELSRDREVLMARLVILGKSPGVDHPGTTDKNKNVGAEPSTQAAVNPPAKPKPAPPAPVSKPAPEPVKPVAVKVEPPAAKPAAEPVTPAEQNLSLPELPSESVRGVKQYISIEKFTVTKDGNNGDLLVRFDIRNISKAPGDVSGRIFTVLKPETNGQSQWLVVPSSRLENGMPAEYRKGQYFSIAHFKPVKFRIKNSSEPDYFKKASIFIYNNKGEVIVEKLIDITEAE